MSRRRMKKPPVRPAIKPKPLMSSPKTGCPLAGQNAVAELYAQQLIDSLAVELLFKVR